MTLFHFLTFGVMIMKMTRNGPFKCKDNKLTADGNVNNLPGQGHVTVLNAGAVRRMVCVVKRLPGPQLGNDSQFCPWFRSPKLCSEAIMQP